MEGGSIYSRVVVVVCVCGVCVCVSVGGVRYKGYDANVCTMYCAYMCTRVSAYAYADD